MSGSIIPWENEEDEPGCAYILDEGGVGRACGAPRLIARRIMRCAMSLMAAQPRLTACAKWKRSQKPSAVAAAAKAADLLVVS